MKELSDKNRTPWIHVAMAILAGAITFAFLKNFIAPICLLAAETALIEIAMAVLIFTAAGGYAWPVVNLIAPKSAPLALRIITAMLVGLWGLSTAIMSAGALADGALIGQIWWPVIGCGTVLAIWFARRRIMEFGAKHPPIRKRRTLVWIILTIAAGVWLAGATVPPGLIGHEFGGAFYDVLEYHLQVPRQWLGDGRISPLENNCYSFYPLGVEMLFLLGMILRGGAYEGMYLAKIIHGAMGAAAVAAVIMSMRHDDTTRGRFSGILLATTPILLFLGWLAMVELAMICALTVALLWLREWVRDQSYRSAICIGLMVGFACAVKYLSVLFVAGPLLAVMLAYSLRSWRRAAQVAIASSLTVLLFSPWLIRNVVHTGNAVFPLATQTLGRGHWSEESVQRWRAGHSPGQHPPVPKPSNWKPKDSLPNRFELLFKRLLISRAFGPVPLAAVIIALIAVAAMGRSIRPFDAMLGVICVLQTVLWMILTKGMYARFISPIAVPAAMLVGGALAGIAALGRWRALGAWACVGLFAGANLILAGLVMRADTRSTVIPPYSGRTIVTQADGAALATNLPEGSRILLVGDAKGFYFPQGTVYATAFDTHPLAKLIDSGLKPAGILAQLRLRGITHVWVDWGEMGRLKNTYGYSAALSRDILVIDNASLRLKANIFEQLGLKAVTHLPGPRGNEERITLYAVGPADNGN